MKDIMRRIGVLVVAASTMAGLMGCASVEPEREAVRTGRIAGTDMSYSWQGFPQPCPEPGDAQILVEKQVPRQVLLDAPYSYEIRVSNRASYPVNKMTLTDIVPDNFQVTSTKPVSRQVGSELKWDLGTLAPNQVVIITVNGKATKEGMISHKGAADLNFGFELTSFVTAVVPSIGLEAEAPGAVVVGDLIPVELTFLNDGGVELPIDNFEHVLPEGLATADGRTKLELRIGNLGPGDTKSYSIDMRALKTGIYELEYVATAKGGLKATATTRTVVQKPTLVLTARAPAKRYLGNTITYDISLLNNGDAVARNTEIRQVLPADTTLQAVDEGGTVKANTIIWNVGTLNPKESKKVSSSVVGTRIATARSVLSATAHAASPVETVLVTEVEGIAALLMGVDDINDPVPVGDTETYIITVLNQGSLPGTRIVVTCMLTEEMEFVKSEGATKSTYDKDNHKLVFESLPALAPQAQAVWRVTVKAVDAGDVRFTAQVESDQLTRPVVAEESTHFYH